MIKMQFGIIKEQIDKMIPYKDCEYRNYIIAKLISEGKQEKMTDDWLRKVLIGDIEDGFITYGQALTLEPLYRKAINTLGN